MLGKLLKYELKANAGIFLPMYATMIIVALFTNFSILTQWEHGAVIGGIVVFGLMVAIAVLTLIFIIQRFHNNLLGDEGYLMFTLPVNIPSLTASKLLAAAIWICAGVITGLIACFCLSLNMYGLDLWQKLWQSLPAYLVDVGVGDVFFVIGSILMLLFSVLNFILMIYTALSIGQLPRFAKHRLFFSFLAFIVITIILQIIGSIIGINVDWPQGTNAFAHTLPWVLISQVILGACLMLITNYLLDKKLNLE